MLRLIGRKLVRLSTGGLWLTAGLSFSTVAVELPFWRTKEKVYARVRAYEPMVSVSTTDLGSGRKRLNIVGGGRVRAARDSTFRFARDLERVARLSGYVESVTQNAAGDRLHLVFKALGQRAEFDLKVTRDDLKKRVGFEILGGPLTGLYADLDFNSVNGRETEVGIDGHLDFQKSLLRGVLLPVGLEGVFKAMAEKLRDGAEAAAKDVDKI